MQTVESVIAALPYKHQTAVQTLRSMILKADPGLVESVKWGTPVYSRGRNLISIAPQPEHINLQFWEGATLASRHACIEGDGPTMRHVRVPYEGKTDYDKIAVVIQDAVRRPASA
jgi:hypothetical protein